MWFHVTLATCGLMLLGCQPPRSTEAASGARSADTSARAVDAAPVPAAPDLRLTWNGSEVVFASSEEARALLGSSDEFTRMMGDFDRSVRTGNEGPITEQAFLLHAGAQARAWPVEALPVWRKAVLAIGEALSGLGLKFPPRVLLVVSSGKEELDAPYTRGNAIIVPVGTINRLEDPFRLLAHEMFHVASRHDPTIRDPLYAALGFHRVPRVSYPDELAARRITNPDAVTFEHAIRVKRVVEDKQELEATALFYSKKPLREAIAQGLLASLALELVELPAPGSGAKPRIIPVASTDYLERASINTDYAIHPEETLADNFALLLARRASRPVTVPRPEVLERIQAWLAQR